MSDLPAWHEAAAFGAFVHKDQLRKDGKTPYFAHPARVALHIATRCGCDDPDVLAAALLHDAIEDCDADFDEVAEVSNPRVARIAAAMSKDMRMPEPVREPAYDDQLRDGPWEARLVKLADVYDNLADAHDEPARKKLIGKAKRAMELTDGDRHHPPIEKARQALDELVAQIRPALGQ